MSYKEFSIDDIPYEEFKEEEVQEFESLGKQFINMFIEKPKEIRKEIIAENKKELDKEVNSVLETNETIKEKYLGNPGTVNMIGGLFAMLVTMPGAFLTNFGDRALIVETDRRLIIMQLGNFYDFLEKFNIRFNDIEQVRFNRKDKVVRIKRKKVTNIHDYFFPAEWRIPRNFKLFITSDNWEQLFNALEGIERNREKLDS